MLQGGGKDEMKPKKNAFFLPLDLLFALLHCQA